MSHQDHLPIGKIRPRFELETALSVEALVDLIKQAIEERKDIDARFSQGYANLFITKEDQHYWSPQLTLNVTANEKGSLLEGIYGPKPEVWMMFVFFYSVIGILILFLSVFGFASYSIGIPTILLWFVPPLILLFFSLYLTSYFGKKIGHDQMVLLHEFVELTLDAEIR